MKWWHNKILKMRLSAEMSFNPDLIKQVQQVIFSPKLIKFFFNNSYAPSQKIAVLFSMLA